MQNLPNILPTATPLLSQKPLPAAAQGKSESSDPFDHLMSRAISNAATFNKSGVADSWSDFHYAAGGTNPAPMQNSPNILPTAPPLLSQKSPPAAAQGKAVESITPSLNHAGKYIAALPAVVATLPPTPATTIITAKNRTPAPTPGSALAGKEENASTKGKITETSGVNQNSGTALVSIPVDSTGHIGSPPNPKDQKSAKSDAGDSQTAVNSQTLPVISAPNAAPEINGVIFQTNILMPAPAPANSKKNNLSEPAAINPAKSVLPPLNISEGTTPTPPPQKIPGANDFRNQPAKSVNTSASAGEAIQQKARRSPGLNPHPRQFPQMPS